MISSSTSLEKLDQLLPSWVDKGLPRGGEFIGAELAEDQRTSAIIALLVWHGFLPMASHGSLLGKLHRERTVMAPGDAHVGRKVRRRAKEYHMTVDTAWPDVVKSVQQHTFTNQKGDCWLSDRLANTYRNVSRLSDKLRHGVTFHSVELWHSASGALVAGDIGYTCGSVYSSCTGFALKDEHSGAGTVHLAALGKWLQKCGFSHWDLGMEMPYKIELGGHVVSRKQWAELVRRTRENQAPQLTSPVGDEGKASVLLASTGGVNLTRALSNCSAGICNAGQTEPPRRAPGQTQGDIVAEPPQPSVQEHADGESLPAFREGCWDARGMQQDVSKPSCVIA